MRTIFDRAGSGLIGLRTALQSDTTLQELAKSPLTLNVMTWAYWKLPASDLPKMNSLEERRKHLFNQYIERMFSRRKKEDTNDRNQGGTEQLYLKNQTISWLILLANWTSKESQTIFLIERMQPKWLETQRQRLIYQKIYSNVFGIILSLFIGPSLVIIPGISWGLFFSISVGSLAFITFLFQEDFENKKRQYINTLETLKWSGKKAMERIFREETARGIAGLITLIVLTKWINLGYWFSKFTIEGQKIIVKILGLRVKLNYSDLNLVTETHIIAGLIVGWLLSVIIDFVKSGLHGPGIEKSSVPNQGIWESLKNAGIFTLIFGLLSAPIWGITAVWIEGMKSTVLVVGLLGGLIAGLSFGLYSGIPCFQHFILRIILYWNRYIPWNYARFLDYATERIFLQKVGGGYIFIHRLLRDHFATMKVK